MKKVLILYTKISQEPVVDDLDILLEVDLVQRALSELGFDVRAIPFTITDTTSLNIISQIQPEFVFNLVEPVLGRESLSYVLAPSILEIMGIKFSGCSSQSSLVTMNKLFMKKMLSAKGILTPQWIASDDFQSFDEKSRFIIKPVTECASVGLDEFPVHAFAAIELLISQLEQKRNITGREYFAEKFVDGREFIVNVVGNRESPWVLPPAELIFHDYEQVNKGKIYGYKAKWIKGSFEFENIQSNYTFTGKDEILIEKLIHISKQCWRIFDLNGYASIDFRIDNEEPFVIDINTNPTLTYYPGGVMDFANSSGFGIKRIIQIIIENLL